ncbi:MAG: tail fiber domain-containing protein [Bacteroidota bacterium]
MKSKVMNVKSRENGLEEIMKLKINKDELDKLKGGFIVIEDVCYSDKRLKKNVKPFEAGLKEIMNIRFK